MMMFKKNISEHNSNWPQIPEHLYRILLIEVSGSGKANALLNLIKKQDDDYYSVNTKIYLYIKDQ